MAISGEVEFECGGVGVLGNPISIAWDKTGGQDWIVIRDMCGSTIMRVSKMLWENSTAEMRDSIIEKARRCYG